MWVDRDLTREGLYELVWTKPISKPSSDMKLAPKWMIFAVIWAYPVVLFTTRPALIRFGKYAKTYLFF